MANRTIKLCKRVFVITLVNTIQTEQDYFEIYYRNRFFSWIIKPPQNYTDSRVLPFSYNTYSHLSHLLFFLSRPIERMQFLQTETKYFCCRYINNIYNTRYKSFSCEQALIWKKYELPVLQCIFNSHYSTQPTYIMVRENSILITSCNGSSRQVRAIGFFQSVLRVCGGVHVSKTRKMSFVRLTFLTYSVVRFCLVWYQVNYGILVQHC